MTPTDNVKHTTRTKIRVEGRVQGVGFRPTLYRAVTSRQCCGSIQNTPTGVEIILEGDVKTVEQIVDDFPSLIPARARIDRLNIERGLEPEGASTFSIQSSASSGNSLLPIPPDLATCHHCEAELFDATRRRSTYPFNTCTSCGPRFTIARDIPFDRPTSAMDDFPLCEACRDEYNNPDDRRFHAQTMSCPNCGPTLRFSRMPSGGEGENAPLVQTRRMLASGKIVAIKGLGGFHLACDATDEHAVTELRRRKNRPHKPFAIMAADLGSCKSIALLTPHQEELLTSPETPIVLLEPVTEGPVVASIAPGLGRFGVMLPYTPLHKLLFESHDMPPALVMTSCNRSGEPIATTADAVCNNLNDIADAVLWHNRPIENRCDDSLVASFRGHSLPMRRSRGYVPEPIMLTADGPSVFATGAMWKNTFVLTKGRRAFVSQHIGNVSDADNARHFRNTFRQFSDLLDVSPEIVSCDLHPDYPTTHFARDLADRENLRFMQVQHHHAHVVSCLAEHNESGPAIGVSMDGTGYGDDGCMWGGEFMIFDAHDYDRRMHLEYVPMPGGDQAVLEPQRMALSHLVNTFGTDDGMRYMKEYMEGEKIQALAAILDDRDISPLTSSCGRLFDAVSALVGFGPQATYQGQAACELDAMCNNTERGVYDYIFDNGIIRLDGIIRGIWNDLNNQADSSIIATKFHNTVGELIVGACRRLHRQTGIRCVALSGGVMQNTHLLDRVVPCLDEHGFQVLFHTHIPPNDGGIALGQARIALARMDIHDKNRQMG